MLSGEMTTPLKLVQVKDTSVKSNGLMRVEIHAPNAAIAAVLEKIALLNTLWSKAIPIIESEMSAKLGRRVVLLTGSYIKQSKGQVQHVSTIPAPGHVYYARKGYDPTTKTFWVWVVVK